MLITVLWHAPKIRGLHCLFLFVVTTAEPVAALDSFVNVIAFYNMASWKT